MVQLDEWTSQSLLTNRTVTVGRFTVTTTSTKDENAIAKSPIQVRRKKQEEASSQRGSPKKALLSLSRKHERNIESGSSACVGMDDKEFSDTLEARCRGIASKLEGLTGSSTILPGNRTPYSFEQVNNVKSPEVAFHVAEGVMTDNETDDMFEKEEVNDNDKEKSIRFFPGEDSLGWY